jgi:membrane protein implicated in regulation of membrane protease activity
MVAVARELTVMNKFHVVERSWRKARQGTLSHAFELVSPEALVMEDIQPGQCGRLKYLATYWFARCDANVRIPAGTLVRVLARNGNTWTVKAPTQMKDA